jgi:3-deoxy-7-phosphoheptulonate synthase
MIIVLKPGAPPDVAQEILARIESLGCRPLHMPGTERVVLGALGDERVLQALLLDNHPHIESVKPILTPYKLVSREFHPNDTVVDLGGAPVGGDHFTVIAGPCAVESHEQLRDTAIAVQQAGAVALRGGAFKPRTSPYSFQGLGREGLDILQRVGRELGLPTVTEVMEVEDVEVAAERVTCLQIGARNMQNFRLLTAVGRTRRPVLLKRGLAAKVEDLLLAAEYIVAEGNDQVILCERGIRTFETATRNTLDLNAIPFIKQRSHLPVLVDPSHGTGVRDFVLPMARAAAACGADGVIVEVHVDPSKALSDGYQSLDPQGFARMMRELRALSKALGREMR